jgi:hypothetical protein
MNSLPTQRLRRRRPWLCATSSALLVASLLAVRPANAAEGKLDAPGGKSLPAPAVTPTPDESPQGDAEEATRLAQLKALQGAESGEEEDIDPFAPKYKPWEVGVGFTTHRLIVQTDLEGGASNKFANSFEAYVEYNLTKHDHVSVRAFVMEKFLADAGETGWRFDDMLFSYGHDFTLPAKFKLGAGFQVTAPTSYYSQLAGEYTSLRLSLSLDRRFGPLSMGFRTYGQYDVQRYSSYDNSTQDGGAPTSVFNAGLAGDAELHMPFHEPLSIGVGAGTAYGWVHTIEGQLPATVDPQFPNTQPVQQSYGFEATARYALPALLGVKTDVTFGYADGGPGIGYSSVLHDGVGHFYLGFRTQSELFLSLSASY